MNLFKSSIIGIATVLACVAATSCTSDDVVIDNGTSASSMIDIIKNPDIKAYSGSHTWNVGSRASVGTEFDDNLNVITSTPVTSDFPRSEYLERRSMINQYLAEGKTNTEKVDFDFLYYAEQDLTFTLYYLCAGTARKPNYLGVFYFDKKGQLHKELIWENMNPTDSYSNVPDPETNANIAMQHVEGVQITVKAGYKFGFYWEGHNGTEYVDFYSMSSLNETIYNKTKTEMLNTQAGTFQLDGNTYLGIEDWIDYDYQDWVFFTEVELMTVETDETLPDENVVEEDDDDDPEQPGEDDDPEAPQVSEDLHNNEVEVNLTVEERDDYQSSHLSLHVRHATDVEIFLPVPAEYTCQADDMEIVLKHEQSLVAHGSPRVTTFDVNGHTVSLIVEYQPDGILIRTQGINQDVIDYCRDNFDDGITFEVWNYFNMEIPREELRDILSRSTVRFLDSSPMYYINAFNELGDGVNPDDCTVNIVDSQKQEYGQGYEDEHLNGSDHNIIYRRNTDE